MKGKNHLEAMQTRLDKWRTNTKMPIQRRSKYTDKWGEVWDKIDDLLVKRRSDGNIGGWFNGKGLYQ